MGIRQAILAIPAIFLVLCAAVPNNAVAKERVWNRYENSQFEAFSNGSEKKTIKLMEELVRFRAAVLQVTGIEVPPAVSKTQVFIFSSAKEFKELIGDDNIGGFVTGIGGVPYMAMYVGVRRDSEMVLRHEFAHILLSYSETRYPTWFNEGHAELLSSTRIDERKNRFTLGDFTGRHRSERSPVPWRELVSDDFDPHALGSNAKASDAYHQSWLLTHYLLLGRDPDDLGAYIKLTRKGWNSVDAMESVVGMTIEELGEFLIHSYPRTMQYFILGFEEAELDYVFHKSEATTDDIQSVLEAFRGIFKAD